ncbi:MAG: HYR domain-containing protein, partial [Verrucomicrobia bacterium]|nr:HYR domain-containing protein [Verrucomicrobiota bacterium]
RSVTSGSAAVSLLYASNVTFSQRNGTSLVDIYYDIVGSGTVALSVSRDGGVTYGVPVKLSNGSGLTGDVGTVSSGTSKHIVWDAGSTWPNQESANVRVRVAPVGAGGTFAPIPAGTYTMGNQTGDGDIGDAPVTPVSLSAYSMQTTDVTKAQWDRVRSWALSHGYTDLPYGDDGSKPTHPVWNVSWLQAVEWANAASEMDGLTPCYKEGGAVFRSATRGGSYGAIECDWSANGYRLPTEAEWEIAARGGLVGKRFPLGDTISNAQANFYGSPGYGGYDSSTNYGYSNNNLFVSGGAYTSPAGYYPGNGYGLFDMSGNVFQWCWDRYSSGYTGGTDPQGPLNSGQRSGRGGSWAHGADWERIGRRWQANPWDYNNWLGFRLAHGSGGGIGGAAVSALGELYTATPTVSTQPVGQSISSGGTLSLSVVAGGSVSYQWYVNGGSISGANSPTYTLSPAYSANAGNYYVRLTNLAGSVYSGSVSVTVSDTVAPSFTSIPDNVTVSATSASGATVTYASATATDNEPGTPAIGYSQNSGTTFPIGTTLVTVTATDNSGNASSGTFTVTVLPSIANVIFSQRTDGSKLVDVSYTLYGGTSNVAMAVSIDGGTAFNAVSSLTGDIGAVTTAGTSKSIVWNAGADYLNIGASNVKVRLAALWNGAEGTFAPIPAGSYQRGVNLDGMVDAPVQTISLSAYYMSVNSTTKAQWDAVRLWGINHGYSDLGAGDGIAGNHPVTSVKWYDVVKWANAASEKDGLKPCYTVDGNVYRTGYSNSVVCDWNANGYRLPTEAEWEVAARGGLTGKRFPWGDTISQSQANYRSSSLLSYDDTGHNYSGFHPTYGTQTSPVGSFAPNGYGLYDMAGNVIQWCWDFHNEYTTEPDPHGGTTPQYRILRG